MKELEYPFDAQYLLKKKKTIKRMLCSNNRKIFIEKKIAILGGSTTEDIKNILELFLLNYGIKPSFYESEYNQYYEDGMFENKDLEKFSPDIIYICTSNRNITGFPELGDSDDVIQVDLETIYHKFTGLWSHIADTYQCTIIQNNFEYPIFRLMGNKDASDKHGRVNFITGLNMKFYEYAQNHDNFYICDINYISASYGLEKWSDPFYWYMYKYAMAVPAIPYLSFNVANIIKSVYGKNKKVLNLDLDNTLWGGIVGDDGVDNIEIGQETSIAQVYSEFQEYLKLHKQLGVLLTVNSKNDRENAIAGLQRLDSILHETDFVSMKANWNPKDRNLIETATDLSLLPESFVFVDDNPAERALVKGQIPEVAVPEINQAEHYIDVIDKSGFFEVTAISKDDLERTEMYKKNAERKKNEASFDNYEEYLKSLEMKAEVKPFTAAYMSRIAQLTNKSNQFNLTTRRYTQTEIEQAASDLHCITLYGRLEDKFGDNGVVSVVIGRIGKNFEELHLELWLMSCRVLKRDMEFAMMDTLIEKAESIGITRIYGYYYPTAKNGMVKDFYDKQGFSKVSEDDEGNTMWKFDVKSDKRRNQEIIYVDKIASFKYSM